MSHPIYVAPGQEQLQLVFSLVTDISVQFDDISRSYGQCRRAAFMKHRYLQFNKVFAVRVVVVLAGAVVVPVAAVVVAPFKQLCVTAGSGEPAVT